MVSRGARVKKAAAPSAQTVRGRSRTARAAERNCEARGKSISGAPMTSLFSNDKTLK